MFCKLGKKCFWRDEDKEKVLEISEKDIINDFGEVVLWYKEKESVIEWVGNYELDLDRCVLVMKKMREEEEKKVNMWK